MQKMKEIPKFERPREKFLEKGPDALTNSELLAILLGSGIRGTNVKALAQKISHKFGDNLMNATVDDLIKVPGIGKAKALQIVSMFTLAKRVYEKHYGEEEEKIISPIDAVKLVPELKTAKREHLISLYLNARNVLIHKEIVSIGTLDKSIVHPREVFAPGIEKHAASVIVIHNHPSGNPSPSEEDKQVATRIVEAGKIVGINVLDFIIVAEHGIHSILAEFKNIETTVTDYVADGNQVSLFDILVHKSEVYSKYNEEKIKKNVKKNDQFRFIDLFAGIGGFHLAAEEVGGVCVFSSEYNDDAREIYEKNFKKINEEVFKSGNFKGDITKVDEKKIPDFDFLFAGFPCQPFSKGGYRKGFEDTRGTLFFDVARIVKYHRPPFILLENVPNLVTHDDGKTFRTIMDVLRVSGYAVNVEPLILSPHLFGAPVIRQRIYIPAIRKDLMEGEFFRLDFSANFKKVEVDAIFKIIENSKVDEKYFISEYEEKVLDTWNEFYKGIDIKIIGFPIWADDFGKNYNLKDLPEWKKSFILKNRNLYLRNKDFIDSWLKKNNQLSWMVPTHRKMEWQAGVDISDIYEGLIQFRPSGVRVKRPDKFSTLVAMNHPQIVGKYKRRLTPDEVKRLQSFPQAFEVHQNDNIALRQLGNAVNVDVVKMVIQQMFNVANT